MNRDAIDMVTHALHELRLATSIEAKIITAIPQKQDEFLIEFLLGGSCIKVRCLYRKLLLQNHVNELESQVYEKNPVMIVTGVLQEKMKYLLLKLIK